MHAPIDAHERFDQVLKAAGLRCPSLPVVDQRFHRVPTSNKPRDKAGWYIADELEDGNIYALYGCWRNGWEDKWNSRQNGKLSHKDQARCAELKKVAEEEKQKTNEAAKLKAEEIITGGFPCADYHKYAKKKSIKGHNAVIADDGRMAIPVYFDDELVSLQHIDDQGGKLFLKGGRTKGGYCPIEGDPDQALVCEGFATGATLAEVTGRTVYCAFNAGNLDAVTAYAKTKHPQVVISGDDDRWTEGNPGRTKAEAAAKAHGCKAVFPTFANVDDKPTDFNDLFLAEGSEKIPGIFAKAEPPALCLYAGDWLKRDIPPQDYLQGEVFSTTTRSFLAGPTGLGKSIFGLDIAGHMAAGMDFLHWPSKRRAKVLYVDGEMPVGLAKARIAGMAKRLGEVPPLAYSNTEDWSDFQPLNTPEGQLYIDHLISQIGGVDFVFLDNLMSLISGSMIEEGPWAETLPWVKSLTTRKIGVCIVDHTGNDPNKTYGTTTKKWQFDSVMLMKDNKNEAVDISFTIEWLKHRLRTPDNRDDFRNFSAELVNNAWSSSEAVGSRRKLPLRETNALRVLQNLLAEVGEKRVTMRDGPNVTVCKTELFREYLKQKGVTNGDNPNSERSQWRSIVNRLLEQQVITIHEPWIWMT